MMLYNSEKVSQQKIFQDIPNDIDETWIHGAILGGIAYNFYKTLTIADAFKLNGDILVDKVLTSDIEAYEIVYPVLYAYRHSLELYLKAILKDARGHNLSELIGKLEEEIKLKYKKNLPLWFRNWILEFDEFDKGSDTFRYADKYVMSRYTLDIGEFWIDFVLLKKIMALYQQAFYSLVDLADQETVSS